jgi:hypothetical protein
MHLLGFTTQQLNHDVDQGSGSENQLTYLESRGVAKGLPDPSTLPAFVDPFGTAPVDTRARDYLAGNCSHCHRPGGAADVSGLWLLVSETEPTRYGVCKAPAAAGAGTGGFQFDVVPGVQLVKDWITSLPGSCP